MEAHFINFGTKSVSEENESHLPFRIKSVSNAQQHHPALLQVWLRHLHDFASSAAVLGLHEHRLIHCPSSKVWMYLFVKQTVGSSSF